MTLDCRRQVFLNRSSSVAVISRAFHANERTRFAIIYPDARFVRDESTIRPFSGVVPIIDYLHAGFAGFIILRAIGRCVHVRSSKCSCCAYVVINNVVLTYDMTCACANPCTHATVWPVGCDHGDTFRVVVGVLGDGFRNWRRRILLIEIIPIVLRNCIVSFGWTPSKASQAR